MTDWSRRTSQSELNNKNRTMDKNDRNEYNGTNRQNDKKEGKKRGKLMRHWKQIKKRENQGETKIY